MPRTTQISLKQNWKDIFSSSTKRSILIGGFLLVMAILVVLPQFFNKIEHRQGVVLHDFVLAALPGHNFSIAIFSIIWIMGLFTLYRAIQKPTILIMFIWTLIFVLVARFASITLVPLDPPIGLVPLTDPVNEIFYGHITVTKDLFFSGHTATMMLIFLCLENRTDKIVAFFAMITVMILLLFQHIHYTIDVLAAPIIVYILFRMTRALFYVELKNQR